ncbi:recombination-associated protein RdgC [Hydrogenophaga sp. NFH-34]|uniref:recombination-associated protein RdgC n=1 Tax=Hydrogenophaga sp. NFH-34 TaxID=2744446 RepID=UPI001F3B2038|nr:recombination-associated protein RdgC [Hydrogenophaga sp. NFH-34]
MFKNINLFRIELGPVQDLEGMEQALDAARFTPCGATQERSFGWVEPRGQEHGPLVESVNGQRLLRFMIETKGVPGAEVRKKAQEEADRIEATTGRKPGKKETKALREDALQALLPQAFARRKSVMVWLDVERGMLITDAATTLANDDLITSLVTLLPGTKIHNLNTAQTPQTAMTQWLLAKSPDDWPEGLAVERECELKSHSEEKSVVRLTRHHLLNDDVRKHITEGKLPTRLALTWEGRIGFHLSENFRLKKLSFLEGVFEDRPSAEGEDPFDSDVALSTGELRSFLPALIAMLGGELAEKSETSAQKAEAGG